MRSLFTQSLVVTLAVSSLLCLATAHEDTFNQTKPKLLDIELKKEEVPAKPRGDDPFNIDMAVFRLKERAKSYARSILLGAPTSSD